MRCRGAAIIAAMCAGDRRARSSRPCGCNSVSASRGDHMPATTLDLRGLKCPLPALKVRKALTRLAPGDLLVAECTDPLAAIDIPNLIRQTGDAIEVTRHEAGLLVFHIRK